MRVVLEERGISIHHMVADQIREVLNSHPENEKSTIERFLVEEKGHIMYMLSKFHCELNPMERVWAQAKRYARAYCEYSIRVLGTQSCQLSTPLQWKTCRTISER